MPVSRACVLVTLMVVGGTASGCASPLLDQPDTVRHDRVPLAPLLSPFFDYEESNDGTSSSWSALLWLAGGQRESGRSSAYLFPLLWHDSNPPYSESTLLFPLYYGRTAVHERWQFFSLLYGSIDAEDSRSDYVLPPIWFMQRSKTEDVWRSSMLFVYDWEHRGERTDFTLLPILGLAHLARWELGYPAEGETVGSLGRASSRRLEFGNLFGFLTLFGYDDVGDRREIRIGTLFSDEVLSPIRSWRGRGEDPFVREWVFPLYANVQDEDGGWLYAGPFWGRIDDHLEDRHTDWWLAGLLSRTRAPEGNTWRVLGIPVSSP